MKQSPLIVLALLAAPLTIAAPAQAQVQNNDIMSILARKAETPPRPAPTTIPYSYRVSVDMTSQEGKDIENYQADLRIDPSQPAGSRAQIISASHPESEAFLEFLEEVEDPEKDMAERADNFWCGSTESKDDSDPDFDLSDFEVVSETDTEATIKPKAGRLAALLVQSDNTEDMGKQERKMMKKLLDRVDGEMTLAKPAGELTSFRVTMTRPMTMMLIAKLKVMDVEQSCALAPNGFYHMSTMNMNVEGKALGSRFGQKMDIQVSELTPLP